MPSDSQGFPATGSLPSVGEGQRERLLAATVEVAGERGWEALTLAEIVSRAGLSKRTVYDLFEDKRGCFLAAARDLMSRVTALVLAAYRDTRTPRDGFAAGVHELLRFCASDPRAARVYLVETAAAGPAGAALWQGHMATMSEHASCALRALRDDLPVHSGTMAVGGIYTVAQARVLAGQAAQLPQLAPDMIAALWIALGLD
jgi:AcrR family transcriptional regulator